MHRLFNNFSLRFMVYRPVPGLLEVLEVFDVNFLARHLDQLRTESKANNTHGVKYNRKFGDKNRIVWGTIEMPACGVWGKHWKTATLERGLFGT